MADVFGRGGADIRVECRNEQGLLALGIRALVRTIVSMSGSRARSVLVVSTDVDRRRDWPRDLIRNGERVSRCAARVCPLLAGRTCDLLAGSSTAIYDEDAVSPELFLALVRSHERPTVLFARDVLADERHHPRFVRVLDHRGSATVFPHLK